MPKHYIIEMNEKSCIYRLQTAILNIIRGINGVSKWLTTLNPELVL